MDLAAILAGVQDQAAAVPAIGNSLKIDFGEQKIFIDGTGDTNVVSSEDLDADCTISITPENFLALTTGKLNPMMAMMTGKVKIKGDMGVAMKLQSLLG
ncbi:MAG: sterol-binding protein [Bacteroidetes bacterium]|jgi:acyl-CoA dehydrogenase|nr:MAG: sterol-binding protein [Bacteroidota bacterium]